ncbi:ganglioside GM2 activator-like [Hemitrygon akajei]|uniref:ganglioside GM2 activator-like n=1 Tax=Hemitrygon akajei TaxID=2704970 RepID=UPI003BF9E3FF
MTIPFTLLICLGFVSTSLADNGESSGGKQPLSRGVFSWANCGSKKNPAVLEALSIQPDPINLPGDLQASATASTSVTLEAPLTVNLTLHKEEAGIWIKVPCLGKIGSCTYNDVCTLLNMLIPPGQNCPEPLFTYGLPCHCPFKAGKYSLPNTEFNIPFVELPFWMTSGNYKAMAVLTSNQEELACVKVSFALKAK